MTVFSWSRPHRKQYFDLFSDYSICPAQNHRFENSRSKYKDNLFSLFYFLQNDKSTLKGVKTIGAVLFCCFQETRRNFFSTAYCEAIGNKRNFELQVRCNVDACGFSFFFFCLDLFFVSYFWTGMWVHISIAHSPLIILYKW